MFSKYAHLYVVEIIQKIHINVIPILKNIQDYPEIKLSLIFSSFPFDNIQETKIQECDVNYPTFFSDKFK